jgi:hypothetical protein
MRINAGIVNMTPAARDSPAEAAVWTMLFSKILDFLNMLSMPMEITAAGMDAETVIPAKRPRYALAPASIIDNKIPKMTDFMVISGIPVFGEFMKIPYML